MKIAGKSWAVVRATLLSPLFVLAIPVAIVAGLISKKRELEPAQLADILRRIADNKIGDEWDEFEHVPLKDDRLEAIRLRALPLCGKPGPVDGGELRRLATEAAALIP